MKLKININGKKPFFAEIPYYLWGEVNYDSDGDCEKPSDQYWTSFYLKNRDTKATLEIWDEDENCYIESDDEKLVYRAARFLNERSGAELADAPVEAQLNDWDHEKAMMRTEKIRVNFENEKLQPFDDSVFWGSWKWAGKFATDFTWAGRWIMDSILENDTRAVHLCASWLRDGTFNETQSQALRYALSYLTKLSFPTDMDWIVWYFGKSDSAVGEGERLFPVPDYENL